MRNGDATTKPRFGTAIQSKAGTASLFPFIPLHTVLLFFFFFRCVVVRTMAGRADPPTGATRATAAFDYRMWHVLTTTAADRHSGRKSNTGRDAELSRITLPSSSNKQQPEVTCSSMKASSSPLLLALVLVLALASASTVSAGQCDTNPLVCGVIACCPSFFLPTGYYCALTCLPFVSRHNTPPRSRRRSGALHTALLSRDTGHRTDPRTFFCSSSDVLCCVVLLSLVPLLVLGRGEGCCGRFGRCG